MAGERRALVLGGTGLVGGALLGRLLADPEWTQVATLGRRPTGRAHPRLAEHTAPLEEMDQHAAAFAVDAVFCALGTTRRKAGSQGAFRAIDLEGVASAARLAAAAGARRFLLVSAAGASPRSRVFYSRVKGEAEEAARAAGVPGVVIVRPSLILGARGERRPAEHAAQVVGGFVAPLLRGPLARVRPVGAATIAAAMIRLAGEEAAGVRVVENEEILALGGR
jgi:uncharacterized protein YbjT (DUF2867 family)